MVCWTIGKVLFYFFEACEREFHALWKYALCMKRSVPAYCLKLPFAALCFLAKICSSEKLFRSKRYVQSGLLDGWKSLVLLFWSMWKRIAWTIEICSLYEKICSGILFGIADYTAFFFGINLCGIGEGGARCLKNYKLNHLDICCSWLHRLELLRQAQEKDGNSGHKLIGKQPVAIELPHWVHSTTTRLHYHYIGELR